MYQNVIEFPRAAIQNLQRLRPVLELRWRDSGGMPRVMATADRAMIRRQMEYLRRRGVMAECRTGDGTACGIVHAITAGGNHQFRAHLEGESWGDT